MRGRNESENIKDDTVPMHGSTEVIEKYREKKSYEFSFDLLQQRI